jgi:anti-sigma factor ChrR (cupin superfamily)
MDSTDLLDLVALDAAGALDEEEQRSLRERLTRATAEEREMSAQLYDAAAMIAVETVDHALLPAPGVRDRLLARISSLSPTTSSGPGIYSMRADEGTWIVSDIPGVRVKVLSLDRDRDLAVMLLRVAPGSRYPAHSHSTAEECYVISGEITIHGRRLGAGDFHHAEAHSHHDVIFSERGAEVLLVASPRDYLS